jgi:hypothetical protein
VSAAGTANAGQNTTGPDTPPNLAPVQHLARHQINGSGQHVPAWHGGFLPGMAASLTGLPAETSGAAHLASITFLTTHALIALARGTDHPFPR